MNDTQEDLVVVCSCSLLNHVARFSHWDAGAALIEVTLEWDISFWRRFVTAVRYLFKRTCAYGSCASFVVAGKDLPRVKAWIDRATNAAPDHLS